MGILTVKNLSKSYGDNQVIRSLSLDVPEGSVYGFIGRNGAGKTTTMRMILGLLRPDGGQIEICGEAVRYGETKTNRHVGYLPDVPEFYGYMRPMEYLSLCGEITGLSRDTTARRSRELLALVGLADVRRKIGGFSRGMKQRLGIAQALLGEPKLLICDEPTSALDPVGRKEILDILRQVKASTTVLFSTHILADVERICDQVGILESGKIMLSGTLAEMRAHGRRDRLLVAFAGDDDLRAFLAEPRISAYAHEAVPDEHAVILTSEDLRTLQWDAMHVFGEKQLLPQKYEVMEPTLENLFLEVAK